MTEKNLLNFQKKTKKKIIKKRGVEQEMFAQLQSFSHNLCNILQKKPVEVSNNCTRLFRKIVARFS